MFPEVALAQDGIWTTRAPLPTARLGASAATVNGKIYVVGGAGTSGTCGSRVGTLEVYDPATGSWSTRAPMPTPRDSTAAVAVGERLYVIGGDNICLGMLSTVEVYDPITDTWTTKAPMPTPRSGLAAAVVDGIVYAIGGVNFTSGWLATVEAYNPVSNNWSVRALMPTARGGLGVEVVDGVIYAVGGVNATTQLTSVEAYDPKTDSWSAKTPMPTPRCCSAVGLVRGILYVAGGVAVSGAGPGDNSVRTVESYNPALNAWSSAPPMPTDRSSPASAVAQDTLFVMGGVSFPVPGFTILAVNEAFSPFLMVSIDIKPGDSTNTINLKSNGVVPVAILGSKTFDPMTVDPSTVTFAGAHVATRGRGAPMTGQADVNGDG
ncbi:MAG TPA: kelch repeat-containing protein [Terriglobia bacterium]|nr:kelch repeat-containing protein [Terriglobia bacterium]